MIRSTDFKENPRPNSSMTLAAEVLSDVVEADGYLHKLLAAEAVDTSAAAPVMGVRARLLPLLRNCLADRLLAVEPTGAFVKGTAIRSCAHLDLLLSIAPGVGQSLRELHDLLFSLLYASGYSPWRHGAGINVRVQGYSVDVLPGYRERLDSEEHQLYLPGRDVVVRTNPARHSAHVRSANRLDETRILKLWSKQHRLDLPSLYLELVIIRALAARSSPYVSANVSTVLEYLRDAFAHAQFVDPANEGNVVSDLLTPEQKRVVAATARVALAAPRWRAIVR
ncbi:nucleotidyltransferase [Acidobacteria bacterium AB60]|nr:nucleotidyltransferase [Acidobacteria bacterium AB60]